MESESGASSQVGACVRDEKDGDDAENQSAEVAEGDEPSRDGAVGTVLCIVRGVLELVEKAQEEEKSERGGDAHGHHKGVDQAGTASAQHRIARSRKGERRNTRQVLLQREALLLVNPKTDGKRPFIVLQIEVAVFFACHGSLLYHTLAKEGHVDTAGRRIAGRASGCAIGSRSALAEFRPPLDCGI